MIKKEKFVEILRKMEKAEDVRKDIDDIFKKSGLWELEDFGDSFSIMICFDDLIIDILEDMFNTDMICYWVYDLNFGKNYFDGCILDKDNNIIDIGTPEKLYDCLVEDLKNESKIKN